MSGSRLRKEAGDRMMMMMVMIKMMMTMMMIVLAMINGKNEHRRDYKEDVEK